MYNRAILIGRLGQDPELKYTGKGSPYCTFSIATNERRKSNDGTTKDSTTWHRIVVWGSLAEACKNNLSKGKLISVDGKINNRQWVDKGGNRRYTTEIVAERVVFLEERGNASNAGRENQAVNHHVDDDDIPF